MAINNFGLLKGRRREGETGGGLQISLVEAGELRDVSFAGSQLLFVDNAAHAELCRHINNTQPHGPSRTKAGKG